MARLTAEHWAAKLGMSDKKRVGQTGDVTVESRVEQWETTASWRAVYLAACWAATTVVHWGLCLVVVRGDERGDQ